MVETNGDRISRQHDRPNIEPPKFNAPDLWKEVPKLNQGNGQASRSAAPENGFLSFSDPYKTADRAIQPPKAGVQMPDSAVKRQSKTDLPGGASADHDGSKPKELRLEASKPAAGQAPDHTDHKVTAGENLWKIAQHSLTEAGKDSPTARQINNRVQSIIEANKGEYPGLSTNPGIIKPDQNLKIPTQDQVHEQHPVVPIPRARAASPEGEGSRHKPKDSSLEGQGQEAHERDTHGHRAHGRRHARSRAHHNNDENVSSPESHESRQHGREQRAQRRGDINEREPRGQKRDPQVENDSRDHTGNGPTRESEHHSWFGKELAKVGESVAHGLRSVGWCAKGVAMALDHMGVHVPTDGNAVGLGHNLARNPHFQRVEGPLEPGDIIIRNHGPAGRAKFHGRNPGDAGIYLGNGMQANDHIQRVTPNGRYYSSLVAYRYVGSQA